MSFTSYAVSDVTDASAPVDGSDSAANTVAAGAAAIIARAAIQEIIFFITVTSVKFSRVVCFGCVPFCDYMIAYIFPRVSGITEL